MKKWIYGSLAMLVLPMTAGHAEEVVAAPRIEYIKSYHADQLKVSFNVPMKAPGQLDSGLLAEGTAPRVTPDIGCHWSWLSSRELNCTLSGDARLRPASRYQITVPAMSSADGAEVPAAYRTIETARPELESNGVTWLSPQAGQLLLAFSADVELGSLSRALYLRDPHTQKRWMFSVLAAARPDQARAFVADLPVGLRAGTAYVLGFGSGIKPLLGELDVLPSESSERVVTPADFRYLGASCAPQERQPIALTELKRRPRCAPAAGVLLWFSEQPSDATRAALQARFQAKFESSFDVLRLDGKTQQPIRATAVRLSGLASQHRFDLQLSDASDQWQRPLARARIRFSTQEWVSSLTIDDTRETYRPGRPVPLGIRSINVRRLVLKLEQVTEAGIRRSRHRIKTPEFAGQLWQEWTLDLAPYLDARGALVRGSLELPDGKGKAGFGFNYSRVDLLVRHLNDHLQIWAVDAGTLQPIADLLIALHNGWDVTTPHAGARTDASGFAELRTPPGIGPYEQNSARYDTWWLRLAADDLFAAKPLDGYGLEGGEWGSAEPLGQPLAVNLGDALVWGITDKHLYSPGDRLEYTFFVRRRGQATLSCVERKTGYYLAMFNQDEEIIAEQGPVELDARCSASGRFELPARLSHGPYHIIVRDHPVVAEDFHDDVEYSAQPFRGRFWFEVANPRPPPVNVTVKPDRAIWETWTGPLTITTSAQYFSGGPQTDAVLELEGGLTTFSAYAWNLDPRKRQFPHHVFEVFDAEERTDELSTTKPIHDERAADSDGSIRTSVEAWSWMPGYGKIYFDGTSDGRDGQQYEGWGEEVVVFHNTVFVGIDLRTWLPRVNQALNATLVVLGRDFSVQADQPIRLTLYRHATVDDRGERGEAVSHCEVRSRSTPVSCALTPTEVGQYELVAAITDSRGQPHEASELLSVYPEQGWLGDSDDQPEPEFRPDQPEYAVGDTARLQLLHPYRAGRALVSVERNGLLSSSWIDLTPEETLVEVPVTEAMRHGATVRAALFIRDAGVAEEIPVARLQLKLRAAELKPVVLSVDRPSYRPGDQVTASIQLTVPARRGIAVTVVDRALLKLMGQSEEFFSPDNNEFLRTVRTWKAGYQVDADNWISQVAEQDRAAFGAMPQAPPDPVFQHRNPGNAFGEEGSEQLERIEVTGSRIKRTDLLMTAAEEGVALPISGSQRIEHWRARIRQQFRQTAHWLAQGETDAQGRARLDFQLPDNLTGWTLMAISYDADNEFGFGSFEFVAQLPIEARITGPDSAVMGDRLGVSAVIRNAEDRTKQIKAQLTLSLSGDETTVVKRARHRQEGYSESLLANQLDTAGQQSTSATARWLVQAQDASGEDAVAGEVFVRAPIVDKRLQSSVLVPADQSLMLEFAEPHDSYDHSATLRWRPVSLLTGVPETVKHMHDYPHRCWEQRTSRVWSALLGQTLLGDAANSAEPAARRDELLDEWIRDAVQFQTPTGGFGFWQNADEYASVELSAYTAEAIQSFRALGWKGGAEIERRLQSYLRGQWEALSKSAESSAPHRRFPLLSVVDPSPAIRKEMARMLAQSSALPNDGLIRLLWAYWQRNPASQEVKQLRAELISRGFERAGLVELSTDFDRGYHSWLGTAQSTRCRAASMLARTAATAEERIETYRWLRAVQLQRSSTGEFGNTQDNTYCLQAVADLTAAGVRTDADPDVTLAVGSQRATRMAADTTVSLPLRTSNRIAVRTVQSAPAWLEVLVDYPADARRDSDRQQGFSLKRSYEVMRAGSWIAAGGNDLHVGDWVRVTLDVHALNGQTHVALSDALPGALVAVDPEHDATVPLHLLGEPARASAFYEHQYRAGYARFYAELLYPGAHRVQYLAKVITHGRYQSLPARLEAMYDPSRFATSSNQTFEVPQPE